MPFQENSIALDKWENVVGSIPDGSVNLVVTDPPYGCTPASWDKRPYWEFFWAELTRVCCKDGQAWVFVRMPWAIDVHLAAVKAGWRFVQERVWEKQNGSGVTVKILRKVHENIWHYKRPGATTFNLKAIREPKTSKGDKSIAVGKGRSSCQYISGRVGYTDDGMRLPKSVIFCPNLHQSKESLGHPTQKPEALIEPLVLYSSNPGDLVFDPFAGTGTTLVVAKKHGRRWFGIEMTPKWHTEATARLAGEIKPTKKAVAEPQGTGGFFDEL